MRINLTLLLLLALMGGVPAARADDGASRLLEASLKALREAPSLSCAFKVAQGGRALRGTLTLEGRKMALSTPEMEVWYDGTTQWAYSPGADEVNVTEPTAAEAAQTNPLNALAADARSMFRVSSPAKNLLVLTPRRGAYPTLQGDVKELRVTLDPRTHFPTEIVSRLADGSSATVTITNMRRGGHLPLSTFRYPAGKHPGAEIVDLR